MRKCKVFLEKDLLKIRLFLFEEMKKITYYSL